MKTTSYNEPQHGESQFKFTKTKNENTHCPAVHPHSINPSYTCTTRYLHGTKGHHTRATLITAPYEPAVKTIMPLASYQVQKFFLENTELPAKWMQYTVTSFTYWAKEAVG